MTDLENIADLIRTESPADHESEAGCQRVLARVIAIKAADLETTGHGRDDSTGSGLSVRCPSCGQSLDLTHDKRLDRIDCPRCSHSFALVGHRSAELIQAGNRVGHFELVAEVGSGSFGSVWRAIDTELERTVAIKFPRQELMSDADAEKFLHEARAAATLNHPNIISVHEIGREQGTVFIVSDFMAGETLSEFLGDDHMTDREAAETCAKICDALHHAHENGIIHRDLKPSNIGIDGSLQPYIMDFGLALRSSAEMTMTVDGKILGTPAYMSPEQAKGDAHAADRRSDIYSLGVILFQLLTGERPFRGNVQMLLQQMIHEDPPNPRKLNATVPRDLATICLKCLEKSPDRRYPTAEALGLELRRFLDGRPILARPISNLERGWRWCCRNPQLAILATLLMVSLVTGTAVSTWKWREAAANAIVADREKENAVQSANTMQQQAAELLFQRGMTLCEEGRAHEGVHYFLEALTRSPDLEELGPWQAMVAANIELWMQQIPRLKWQIECENVISDMQVSPDDSILALGTFGGHLIQLESSTGKILSETPPVEAYDTALFSTTSVVFHPREDFLVSSTGAVTSDISRGIVRRIQSRTGEVLEKVFEAPGNATSVCYNEDASQLAVFGGSSVSGGTGSAWLYMFDPKSPGEYGSQIQLGSYGGGMEASLVGSTILVTQPSAASLAKMDFQSRKLQATEWPDTITRLRPHPNDGTFVAVDESTTKVGALPDLKIVATVNHEAEVAFADFQPDGGGYIVSTGSQPEFVDAGNYEATRIPMIPVGFARYDHQGSSVYSYRNTLARAWSLPTRFPRRVPAAVVGMNEPVATQHIACSVNGKKLCSAQDYVARIRDAETLFPIGPPLVHPYQNVRICCFSPDGKLVATTCHKWETIESLVRIWDAETGLPASDWIPQLNWVSAMAFTPDGTQLVTGNFAAMIEFWDVGTGERLDKMFKEKDLVMHVAIRPDGKQLISGMANSRSGLAAAHLWDIVREQPVGEPIQHGNWVAEVAYSPDGSRAATISGDGTLKLVNPDDGKTVGEPIPYSPSQGRAVFSPDSQRLLTGGSDGAVRFWDANDARPVEGAVLRWKNDRVTSLAFSPDGKTFVVGLGSGRCQWCDVENFEKLGPPRVMRSAAEGIFIDEKGQSFVAVNAGGGARSWRLELPTTRQASDAKRFRLSVEKATALEFDPIAGSPSPISNESWQSKELPLEVGVPNDASRLLVERLAEAIEDRDPFAQSFWLERIRATKATNWQYEALAGDAAASAGDFTVAAAYYKSAEQRGASSHQLRNWRLHQVALSRASENWQLVEWHLSGVIDSGAHAWDLYRDRAAAYDKLGDPDGRAADIDRALAADPDRGFIAEIADERAMDGRWEEALQLYERANAESGVSMQALSHHVVAALLLDPSSTNRLATKLLDFLETVPLTLGNARVVAIYVAYCNADSTDETRALSLAQQLADFYSEDQPLLKGGSLYTLGMVQMRFGKYKKAIKSLEESIELVGGEHQRQSMALALTYGYMGDKQKAREHAKKMDREAYSQAQQDYWSPFIYKYLCDEIDRLLEDSAEENENDANGGNAE